ncbi:MAG: hypothetical protein B7X80_09910 [Sulfurovum sp. 17-42-90]|nr:MAG: hypothetical protein B7X80_09910 [Sulfurovum sp. 17-42-90]
MKKSLYRFLLVAISSTLLHASQEVVVDLSEQKAYALEDGSIVSNLWPKPKGGAVMPYMLRLNNDGIAMHLGAVPNRPASHGCIRLSNGFAQKMFAWARVGTTVVVEGDAGLYGKTSDDVYADEYAVIDIHE